MRQLSPLAITLALTWATVGCGPSSRSETPPSAGGSQAYPAAYRDLALPEIEGGIVTDTGRQTTSLRDGIIVSLDSAKSVDDARAFYTERLAAAGWAITPAGRGALPGLPTATVEATRDNLHYQVTITAGPEGGTRIRLAVRQD